MQYQTILGISSSDSIGKLKALRLPSLQGKSFLDLGCNEGFFCGAALAAGACRVVGVDAFHANVVNARKYFPEAEFIESDWTNYFGIHQEHFDVILFASAIHYAADQEATLSSALSTLSKNGTLVLECGLATIAEPGQKFATYQRWDGERLYFTLEFIKEFLRARGFRIFVMSKSVKQAGDEIPRYVLHIRRLKKCLLLNIGRPNSAKTYLGEALGSSVVHKSTDEFAHSFIATISEGSIRTGYDADISQFWNTMVEANRTEEVGTKLFEYITRADGDHDVIYAEGYLPEAIATLLREKLRDCDVISFFVHRFSGRLITKDIAEIRYFADDEGIRFVSPPVTGAIEEIAVHQGTEARLTIAGWYGSRIECSQLLCVLGDIRLTTALVHGSSIPGSLNEGRSFATTFTLPQSLALAIQEGNEPEFFLVGADRIYRSIAIRPRATSKTEGGIDGFYGAQLWGWFLMEGVPPEEQELVLSLDEKEVSRSIASQYRPDLSNRGKGDGRCGFMFKLPDDATGTEIVKVARAGSSIAVPNGGRPLNSYRVAAPPGGIHKQGQIDGVLGDALCGWAYFRDSIPLQIVLYLDGKEVARSTPDQYRADLANAGIGDGHCGFQFSLPNGVTGQELVAVRVAGSPVLLRGSGRPLSAYLNTKQAIR